MKAPATLVAVCAIASFAVWSNADIQTEVFSTLTGKAWSFLDPMSVTD